MVRSYQKIRFVQQAFFAAIALGSYSEMLCAREFFNPELIELDNPGAGKADLSRFESGAQAPGTYHVEIVLNEQVVDAQDIAFTSVTDAEGNQQLAPCLGVDQLKSWGVKTESFPALSGNGGECADLRAISQASTTFEFSTQRLIISIPQAAISAQARDYVPPDKWDEGVTAALLNYSVTGASNQARSSNGYNGQSQYANLRPGINLGPWRLRNYTTWSRDPGSESRWDQVYTYAQRAIIPLRAQLMLGDSTAPADVFDMMPFRGAQLASDDEMLPDSQKGYAPIVRGIARTQAQVVVRQNGYQIYQSYVSPGAFEITDMYPTGGAGDLDVTIKEADGSEQHFTVPFASLPVLQREGRLKYALTAGQYRAYNASVEKTPFGQVTGILGMAHGFTLYGGVQTSSKYHALAVGMGKNLGAFGAISADVTQARSSPKDIPSSDGQAWRARYNKNFVDTGTNFAIAGYRYSTRGYYGMQEVLDSWGNNSALQNRRRNHSDLTMSQNLGHDLGSVMLSVAREDYWNAGKSMESWSLGYNNTWHSISYGLTWTLSKNGNAGSSGSQKNNNDQLMALNLSVPLEKLLPQSWANYGANSSKNNGTTHSVGVSGVALRNNALSWNVQQGYGTNGVGNTGNINADYKGTYGEALAGYSYDKNSERLNYGLQGGVVLHSEGVTLSQPLGETNVLIKAPGAKDVDIRNQPGSRTDFRGYTIVSNVSVYRKNDITLETENMPDDVELDITTRTVTPTRGAVVKADYVASVGRRVLMTLVKNNSLIPFGAMVTLADKENKQFIVGDAGQVYLTGLQVKGSLIVTWGEEHTQQCHADFSLPEQNAASGITMVTVNCYQDRK